VFPGSNAASVRQPGGFVMLFDYWPDPGSLLTIAQSSLGSGGYGEFDRQPIAQRKRWLMSRIAVKDAVRHLMWDDGAGDVFPVEIRVSDAGDGRAAIAPWPERAIPAFDASFAAVGEVAVAVARHAGPHAAPDAPGVGIAVAEITDSPDAASPFALCDQETGTLEAACRAEPAAGRATWLTRFLVAKEAAARAAGHGPDSEPATPIVTGAASDFITVAIGGRTYQVRHEEAANPAGLRTRQYVVAWTGGPDPASSSDDVSTLSRARTNEEDSA
jgi:hypothetical protein